MKTTILFLTIFFIPTFVFSQIYGPEGLNMPGTWNGFSNPPSVLALAGAAQTSGGKVILNSNLGVARYQTLINVQSSSGDIVGGTYTWLFTSGPSGGYFNNKWAGVNVVLNTIQTYSHNSGADNSITVTNGRYYSVNYKNTGYSSTDAIFMETSAEPVTISTVSNNFPSRGSGNDGTVTITTSAEKSPEEKIFVRYTTDGWATSTFVEATGSGTTYTATIPDAAITGYNGNDEYYALTTTVASPTHATADMITMKYNNNSGANYPLPVELTGLTGSAVNGKVQLRWSTLTETNNSGFEVQRLVKNEWKPLGTIQGHGTSNTAHEYSYTDQPSTSGTYSYRLKQIDRDGKYSFSDQIEVFVGITETDFVLSQNFPNPFNPTTNISFAVKERQFVSLKVYNLVGQEVTTLVNSIVEPNTLQTVEFNGKDLSSGIYFYALTTKDRHEVRKLMLMK
ncbi:MAG: T9SS type A sorting domain-containing protein [Bacteroidota bacterium]